MVRKGLSRLDGVLSVAEEASNDTRTCTVQTREGRLIQPLQVNDELKLLQVGARLRGIEITADGMIQWRGKSLSLIIPGEPQPLKLAAITENVAWDDQKSQPQEIAPHERSAYSLLISRVGEGPLPIRVTGPLRQSSESGALHLEVKTFEFFPMSRVDALTLVARLIVESPYGLGDPWPALQGHLGRIPWVESAEQSLANPNDSIVLKIRPGFFPDLGELENVIVGSGLGARLDSTMFSGQSLASRHSRGTSVKVCGLPESYQELPIKGGLPRSQWQELQQVLADQGSVHIAWSGHLEKSALRPLRLRLLEWQLLEKGEPNSSSTASASILPPPLLQARTRDGRTVEFEWFDKGPAASGYNLYRQAPAGGWEKINSEPLESKFWRQEVPLNFFYAATALFDARESTYSRLVSPAPPRPPGALKLRGDTGARHLTWKSNTEPDFASYNIFRSTTRSGPYTQIAAGILKPQYTDTTPSLMPFFYVVTATDTSGNQSTFSREVSPRRWFAFSMAKRLLTARGSPEQ